jgi:hypothetical protein
VDFSPIPNPNNVDRQRSVFDAAEDSVIAHAVLPELAQPGTLERLAKGLGVIEGGEPAVKKRKNAAGDLWIELVEVPLGERRQLNPLCHSAS